MPQTGEILSEAYELIEEGNPAQARALLEPLLEREPANQDALWIYAHAAEDPQSGRDTLLKLYQLNPDYPGLASLLNELNIPIPPIASVTREPVLDPGIGDVSNEPVPASYEDDLEKDETENGRGRSLLYLILAGLIVVVVVLLLLNAINSMSPGETPATTEPQVAADTTVTVVPTTEETDVIATEATESSEMVETEALSPTEDGPGDTDVATGDASILEQDLSGIADLLSDHELADNGIAVSETALGITLVVNVCTLPGPEASSEISDIFETIASQLDDTLGNASAIGVGLTDCESNTVLRTVGVSLSDARNFADGTIDSRAFEALWQPV